jgi:hypothetical protein
MKKGRLRAAFFHFPSYHPLQQAFPFPKECTVSNRGFKLSKNTGAT